LLAGIWRLGPDTAQRAWSSAFKTPTPPSTDDDYDDDDEYDEYDDYDDDYEDEDVSPWAEVPSDVLLEVASYLRDDRYALLRLTHVCHYWRQVLIDRPLNWTQISTKYPPKLFKLLFQRSKGVPIDAEISRLPPELYGVDLLISVGYAD
jgi:hypothetical protein